MTFVKYKAIAASRAVRRYGLFRVGGLLHFVCGALLRTLVANRCERDSLLTSVQDDNAFHVFPRNIFCR